MIDQINTVLADESIHSNRLQAFHWNVTGPEFLSLHEFFEELYTESRTFIDAAAERIRFLGGTPLARLQDHLDTAHLKEGDVQMSAEDMVEQLIEDKEHIIADLKDYIRNSDDPLTEDFLVSRAREHEIGLYKLKSIKTR